PKSWLIPIRCRLLSQGASMRRRDFFGVLAGAAAWPRGARSQPQKPLIGFVHGASADGFASSVAAFRRGLSEAGLCENRNVAIDYNWLEGRYEHAAEKIANLVHRPVDL